MSSQCDNCLSANSWGRGYTVKCMRCKVITFGIKRLSVLIDRPVDSMVINDLKYLDTFSFSYYNYSGLTLFRNFYKRHHISMEEINLCDSHRELAGIIGQFSCSRAVDIIAFVKLRLFLRYACRKYYDGIYRICRIQVNQKAKPPIFLTVRYRIATETLLCRVYSHNFAELFPRDFNSDGEFIFRATKYGCDQHHIKLFCDFSNVFHKPEQKNLVSNYLDAHSSTVDEFRETYDCIIQVFQLFGRFEDRLQEILGEYLNEYTANTLLLERASTADKLLLFCKKSPAIAEFIWTSTFTSRQVRESISYRIRLSNKTRSVFVNSASIVELASSLESRKTRGTSFEDRWISELQSMGQEGINLYEELCDLIDYRKVVAYPHWISGYIDGERITMAETLYNRKYSEAQRFYDRKKIKK